MRVLGPRDCHTVECPNLGFVSRRYLLEQDGMGYTITRTTINPSAGKQFWHYKNHLESCYCLRGKALLRDCATEEVHQIVPGTLYVLDRNDPHEFTALEETELLCVFNPPLRGDEVHGEDGTYPASL